MKKSKQPGSQPGNAGKLAVDQQDTHRVDESKTAVRGVLEDSPDEEQVTGEEMADHFDHTPEKHHVKEQTGIPGPNSYSHAHNVNQGARSPQPEPGEGSNQGADS